MEEHGDEIYKYQPLWGTWYIDMPIGKGSFGSVYKISREELGHTYTSAVKIISIPSEDQYREAEASFGRDEATLTGYFEDIVKNIVNEVNMLYSLSGNSNIVTYQDHKVVKKEDGIGWDVLIRMEYVTSLRKYLADRQMTREEIVRLGIDICTALELCSKKGIIHRDIKDENIFINEDGVFKIGDFGIARELSKSGRAASMRGTPLYMAPEVYRGDKYDAAVDVYSLGIVLYKLLNNGRMPFMPPYPEAIRFKDSEEALEKRMTGHDLQLPARSGEVLGEIILKACAYKTEDRYIKASEMKRELEAALAGMSDEEREEKVTIAVAKKEISEKSEINKEAEISSMTGNEMTGNDKTGNDKTGNDKTEYDVTKSLFYDVTQAADVQENQNRTMSIFDSDSADIGRVNSNPETQLYEETVGSGNETLSIFGSKKSLDDKDKEQDREQDNEQDKDKNPEYRIPLETTTSESWNRTIAEKATNEDQYETEHIAEKSTKKRNSKLLIYCSAATTVIVILLCFIAFGIRSNRVKEADNLAAAEALADTAAKDRAAAEALADTAAEDRAAAEALEDTAAEDRAAAEALADTAAEDRAAAEAAIEKISIKVGDYVEFGSYLGEPILWRVMEINDGRPILWSEYILCTKCYDAAESGEFIQDMAEADYRGSNNWSNSNIREWLNTTGKVIFSTQQPMKNAIWGENNYEDELGFLTDFSDVEKSLLISELRQIKNENGTVIENVQDYVRLPSLDELKDYGVWAMDETSRKKYPTVIAVQNDRNNELASNKSHVYYLETLSAYNDIHVLTIKENGNLGEYNVNDSADSHCGITPVIYLSTNIASGGKGTKSVPWKLQ